MPFPPHVAARRMADLWRNPPATGGLRVEEPDLLADVKAIPASLEHAWDLARYSIPQGVGTAVGLAKGLGGLVKSGMERAPAGYAVPGVVLGGLGTPEQPQGALARGAEPGFMELFEQGYGSVPFALQGDEAQAQSAQRMLDAGVHPLAPTTLAMVTPGIPVEKPLRAARKGAKAARSIYARQPTRPQDRPVVQSPDLRPMTQEESFATANQGHHLKIGDDGEYVGAPEGIRSGRDLTRMRVDYDALVDEGAELGAEWYHRQRAAYASIAGKRDPSVEVDVGSIYSQQAVPEAQLGFHLTDRNSLMHGDLARQAKTGDQAEKAWRVREGGAPLDDPKTGIYTWASDPSRDFPVVGTNDLHQGRALGYQKAEGAFTQAQHRFMDYESALAAQRANELALGGRTDWNAPMVQAAAWVAQKGKTDFERGLFPTLRESQENAAKTIGDYFDKHSARAPYESAPYTGIGHEADPGDLDWRDPETGRDVIHEAAGFTGVPDIETTGLWVPDEGPVEMNPSIVPQSLVAHQLKPRRIADTDMGALRAAESLRGAIDVQGGSGFGSIMPAGIQNVGVTETDAVRLLPNAPGAGFGAPGVGPLSREQTADLGGLAKEHFGQGFVAPYGEAGAGIRVFDDFGWAEARGLDPWDLTPEQAAQQQIHRSKEIRKRLPAFEAALRKAGIENELVGGKWSGDYVDREDLWKAGQGTGAVTRALLDDLDAAPPGALEGLASNVEIREGALARLQRDADQAELHGVPVREDVQNLRQIIGTDPNWLQTLRDELEAGTILPGLALPILGLAVASQVPGSPGDTEPPGLRS